MSHLRANWKKYAAAIVVAGAVAGAAHYGVDPELTKEFLRGACEALQCS